MDRRRYLALIGSGMTLSIAGCAGDDDDNGDDGGNGSDNGINNSGSNGSNDGTTGGDTDGDNGSDNGSDNGGSEESGPQPEWAEWLPSDPIIGENDITIVALDVPEIRENIPSLYAEFGVERFTNLVETTETVLEEMIVLRKGGETTDTVLTGQFSKSSLIEGYEERGVSVDEQYGRYDVARGDDVDFALGEGVVVASGNLQQIIDTKKGQKDDLTDASTEWNTMLGYLNNTAVAFAETGIPFDLDLSVAPERSVLRVSDIEKLNVNATYRLQYPGEETAKTAFESDEEEITSDFSEDGVVDETSRKRKQILVTGSLPKENIVDSGGGNGGSENGTDGSSNNGETPSSNYQISFDAPTVVEVGEEWSYTVTIKNIGDGAGDEPATFGVNAIAEGGATNRGTEANIELEPGESETFNSDSLVAEQTGVITFKTFIRGPDNEDRTQVEVEFVSPKRNWGETFETPGGLILRASEPEITDSYRYVNIRDEEEVAQAGPGNVFVFIDIVAENPTDGIRSVPYGLRFELIAGNQLYEPMGFAEYERDNRYDGRDDLPSGTREEGVLPYEVPEKDELRLFHSTVEYEVEWSAE